MPDLDRLPRGLRPAWRAVADALRGQQPPPVVADAVEKALARTIRHTGGGLQWLVGLAEAVTACHEQGSVAPLEAFAANLEPARATGVESAFVDAAWSLAANEYGFRALGPGLETLLEAGLERMVHKLCVGPLEPDLVPGVFSSTTELSTYVDKCVREVQLEQLARQIARRGCSGNIRAPRTRLSRPGTKGLLHEPIA